MAALEAPLDRDEPKREIEESERDEENVRNGFTEREKKIREGDSDTDISDSSSEADSDSDSSSSSSASSTSDSTHSK